jgi:Lrp/AsnC family transcriptional regulator, leucine-responsive regulatory protein
MTLDRLDRRILDLLQNDSARSHAAIGAEIGLSGSAVRRRIEVLRANKVIAREVALLGDGAVHGITVITSVTFERETPALYDAFRTAMRKDARVLQCYATAGQFDYILIVAAASPEDYEAWGERTLLSNTAIKRYDSFVVWSTVKFEIKRPVLHDDTG